MDKKFEQSILDKIKEKKLSPKARWWFLLKDYTVWGLGFVSLLLGSFSVAVIIYMLGFDDWGVYREFNQSLASYIIISLPYFWLIFLALFVLVVYYNFKHTKKGYRYSLSMVLGASILASVLMGIFFYEIGLGQQIDDILSRRAPYYEKVINHRMNTWKNPEAGMLAGMVIERQNKELLLVFDMNRREWKVDIGGVDIVMCKDIVVGKPIRAFGKVTGEAEFKAIKVMPIGPGREFFKRDFFHRRTTEERMLLK